MSEFPILIFAHRSNTVELVDYAIDWGANAIESDIYLQGQQIWVAHDFLPTTGGTKLEEFLNHISKKLKVSEHVVLWLFDLKTTMTADKFKDLRIAVNASFPGNIYKFYCITDETKHLVESYLPQFESMEGINYDADYAAVNTSIKNVLMWRDTHHVANFIYSVGIAAISPANVQTYLKEAVKVRDSRKDFGVYTWTYNKEDTATDILTKLNLNGVMGNMNEKFGYLPGNIKAGKVANLRLATRSDGMGIFSVRD